MRWFRSSRDSLSRMLERLADAPFFNGLIIFVSETVEGFIMVFRRFVAARRVFDRFLQRPLFNVLQFLKNLGRTNQRLGLAEERVPPDEDEAIAQIVDTLKRNTQRRYSTRKVERAANAKTYGVVRGEFRVLPDLPENLAQGVFREATTYRAWIRMADTGSVITADASHVGVVGMSIKLLGVAGPKLMDKEPNTQDFTLIGVRSFTAPDTFGMVELQRQILKYRPAFYFLNLLYPGRFLDFAMQALDSRLLGSPLESQLFSCTPFLHGDGQAVHYSVKPRSDTTTPIPKFPPDNYLREAMIDTLSKCDVHFDFMVQLQKDAHKQPIEDGSIEWKESQTPFVRLAEIKLPRQEFASKGQLDFADQLVFNPWHCLQEHRPLGGINRARRVMYSEMSKYRLELNGEQHLEPTGNERFD